MAKEWIWPPDGDNVPEWATEETQAQVLSVLQKSHGVSGKEKKTRDDLEKSAKKEVKTGDESKKTISHKRSFSAKPLNHIDSKYNVSHLNTSL